MKHFRGQAREAVCARALDRVLAETPRVYVWLRWVAFAVFVPLALTSMDHFVRAMGTRWKQLQRWTRAAGTLTLSALGPALVHFLPLGLPEA